MLSSIFSNLNFSLGVLQRRPNHRQEFAILPSAGANPWSPLFPYVDSETRSFAVFLCFLVCILVKLDSREGHCIWFCMFGFLLVVNTTAGDCLERLVPEMIYYVSRGTLSSTQSLNFSLKSAFKRI